MEDKRKSPRVKRTLLLYYKVKGQDHGPEMSQIDDVSQGGMRFPASREFEKGTVLDIEITSPITFCVIKLLAEVIASNKIGETNSYETRVAFIDLDNIALTQIRQELI